MTDSVKVDQSGSLLIPAPLLGAAAPGSMFSVERSGDVVILRRDSNEADRWRKSTTPAQRLDWLEEWIRSLPRSPALPLDAIGRDSIYE
jgi:hypothetical protein